MTWLREETKRLAFASVQRISYAIVTEIWIAHDSKLTPDAIEMLRALMGDGLEESGAY